MLVVNRNVAGVIYQVWVREAGKESGLESLQCLIDVQPEYRLVVSRTAGIDAVVLIFEKVLPEYQVVRLEAAQESIVSLKCAG